MKVDIENTLKAYLAAFYSQNYDQMLALLYHADVVEYRNKMLEFAEKMDAFGETDEFLRRLKIDSLATMKSLSLEEFMGAIFKLVSREIGKNELNKILNETRIVSIAETDYLSIVSYEYPVCLFGEWEIYEGEAKMIKSQGAWKLLFKSGLEAGLSRFQDEIDRYFRRKSQDNLSNFTHEGDLTKFTLTGFKDFSSGAVVFEPRFKDAGDFSDGLACVQIIRKWGYINTKGEIAIKPAYTAAKGFSQNLAAVQLEVEGLGKRWGFIDKKGRFIISPTYHDTGSFSEGLCAVLVEDKWGYIDKKGELLIPCKFDSAEDFSGGKACVEMYNPEGEAISFFLNKKGVIKQVA